MGVSSLAYPRLGERGLDDIVGQVFLPRDELLLDVRYTIGVSCQEFSLFFSLKVFLDILFSTVLSFSECQQKEDTT